MSKAILIPLTLALTTLAAAVVPQERHLKDTDLRKLGQALREYIDARVANRGVNDAEAEVKEKMAKLAKKLSKTPVKGDILASPADLGMAMWLSYGYGRPRTKGKVENLEYWSEGLYDKKSPLEYALWVPAKYSPKKSYPLVITIPDEGIVPKTHLIERWESGDIRQAVILAAPQMPEDTSTWTSTEGDGGVKAVMVLLRALSESYALDYNRIYLAGRGLGAGAALTIAELFPDRWAGVIGRAGDIEDTRPDNFRNLSTFFAGGGAKVTAFAKAIDELGYGNCTVKPAALEADIWSWIQTTPRVSYPTEITLAPGKPFPNRAYWLQVPASDESGSHIHAKVDRATNTIVVDGEGMTEFVLHFNDVIVDMNKEVTVVANGQEYKDLIPRSFPAVLENIHSVRCDPGRMFVNSKSYHLPTLSEEDEGE